MGVQDAFFRFLVCVEDGLFGWLDSDKLLAACADTASLNATAVGDCADGAQGAAHTVLPNHLRQVVGCSCSLLEGPTRPCGRRPFSLPQYFTVARCSVSECCCSAPAC